MPPDAACASSGFGGPVVASNSLTKPEPGNKFLKPTGGANRDRKRYQIKQRILPAHSCLCHHWL
jgi:hypothetical protein